MSGAQMIVQVIADEGTEAIFGYSGGAILPTYDAVFTFNEEQQAHRRRQVPLIVPANEQGAGFMAAGYARASGRVGVCLVTSGPGRDQHRDAGARLHGRLDTDRRDLRPGRDRLDRHRRLPGGAGGFA
jgi:glyoxylate carboligase